MHAEEISACEKLEIMSYKCITYVPVMVTFGVFSFLFVYYAYVSKLQECPIVNNLFSLIVLFVPHNRWRLLRVVRSAQHVAGPN